MNKAMFSDAKEIKLSKGKVALVDDEDFEWLNKYVWYCQDGRKTKYGVRKTSHSDGIWRNLFLHRLIMELQYGDKRQVDHINGDGLDNRRYNLRISSHSQNLQNRGKAKNNKSGYKGVSYVSGRDKWQASISRNKILYHLGHYVTKGEAIQAYNKAALELHGEFAYQNKQGFLP